MVRISDFSGISDTPPPPQVLGQDNWSRGVISLIDQSKLPKNALKEAINITLSEDGSPKPRSGVDWFGTAASAYAIDGGGMHVRHILVSNTEEVHLLKVQNGTIYRSLNDGQSWTACTGATLTAGKKCGMVQVNDYTYIFNGWDNIVRYDGTTTLQTYTPLTTPVAVSLTKTGLSGTGIYTYRYRVAAVNDVGYTIASTAMTILVDRTRAEWNDTNYVTFGWNAVPGAVRYDIYTGQTADEEGYIDSVEGSTSTTYVDKGQQIEQVDNIAPDSNSTQGPRCADMALVGTRLYATGDRDYPYRIWISGAGRFAGRFSSAYDATYLDWQEGGQLKPVKVVDYRDGKGTPLATVWCKSRDGTGAILQGTLESFTVGDVTFPVPNFYRLPGSRGTEAPFSVVNVLNDFMYYNSQAFYNLGSRAQFLNLLSTDESSANIRPDVQRINSAYAYKIAAHYRDAKVYFSVPMGDETDNSQTMVYDTERKGWLPEGFSIGFERFFDYTDSNGVHRLLAWKAGDTKFTEISDSIRGDYGQAFRTSLVTGLIQVSKNRMDFMFCEEGEVEFANPRGTINVELLGWTSDDEGFTRIGETDIEPSNSSNGWSSAAWSTFPWSTGVGTPVSYSQPSDKTFFTVQRDINAYQYRVQTNDIDADYVLRLLQVNGTATQAGKPRDWERENLVT